MEGIFYVTRYFIPPLQTNTGRLQLGHVHYRQHHLHMNYSLNVLVFDAEQQRVYIFITGLCTVQRMALPAAKQQRCYPQYDEHPSVKNTRW